MDYISLFDAISRHVNYKQNIASVSLLYESNIRYKRAILKYKFCSLGHFYC